MTTMTTDMMSRSLLGRARDASILSRRVPAMVAEHAAPDHEPVAAAAAYVPGTTRAHQITVTNRWLGGFGFGNGTGICSTTVVDDSTKRIHPGRLEGVT